MNATLTKTQLRNTVISMIATIALGIFLAAKPDILAKICVVAGIVVAVAGVFLIAAYFLGKRENGSQMVYGILLLLGGVLLSIIPSALDFLVPMLFGFWVLFSGITGAYRNIRLRQVHHFWWIGLLICLAIAGLGIFLMTRTFHFVETTTKLIGIALIIHGVLRLVPAIMARHYYADPPQGDVIDVTTVEK